LSDLKEDKMGLEVGNEIIKSLNRALADGRVGKFLEAQGVKNEH
jgi:hypothetical protein